MHLGLGPGSTTKSDNLAPLILYAEEPLLRGHPDKRPPLLERPLHNVNLNLNVLISTPDERPPLLKGNISGAKGVASQEGFHCTSNSEFFTRFLLLINCPCYIVL